MIAACPTCGARYRIDASKLRPEGARLRCARCETVFRVQLAAQPQSVDAPAAAKQPRAAAAPAPPPSSVAQPPAAGGRRRLVLVASPEQEAGKEVVSALSAWGLETILVHDGVEAILNIQRALPSAVILDAALPKMFGFQICELMKRNESLRAIKVILVGAIHDQSRYRRPPEELYGADAYTERQDLPDGLRAFLEGFGLLAPSAKSQASTDRAAGQPTPPSMGPAPAPVVPPTPAAPRAPVAQAPTPASTQPDPAQSAEYEKAARLARIIVSDIVLYNQEEFDTAVRAGNVLEALAPQLAEGHALFAERIDPSVADAQEFLGQELLRIARSRGMNS